MVPVGLEPSTRLLSLVGYLGVGHVMAYTAIGLRVCQWPIFSYSISKMVRALVCAWDRHTFCSLYILGRYSLVFP